MPPDSIRGLIPVRMKKTRQETNLEMFISHGAARRRSVARTGLETARRDQVAAGFFAGFFPGFLGTGLPPFRVTRVGATSPIHVGFLRPAPRPGIPLKSPR